MWSFRLLRAGSSALDYISSMCRIFENYAQLPTQCLCLCSAQHYARWRCKLSSQHALHHDESMMESASTGCLNVLMRCGLKTLQYLRREDAQQQAACYVAA